MPTLAPSDFTVLLPPMRAKRAREESRYDFDVLDEEEWEEFDEDEEDDDSGAEGDLAKGDPGHDMDDDVLDYDEFDVVDSDAPASLEEGEEHETSEAGLTMEAGESGNEDWEASEDPVTDDSPFDGMEGENPELSMEMTDLLEEHLKPLAHEAMEQIDRYRVDLDELPYHPNPAAMERDHIRTYDEGSTYFQQVYLEARTRLASTSRAIAAQLRRVLLARSVDRTIADQRRGDLDRRKLSRLNLPGRSRPERRVFKKEIKGETHKVSVLLLIDQSGSMSGGKSIPGRGYVSKVDCAREAAIALGEALEQLSSLGVRFGIWGWDNVYDGRTGVVTPYVDRLEPMRFHEYKRFEESWKRVGARMGAIEAHDNNIDGEAVRWATANLLEQPAERRLLIVFSDGQPAGATALPPGRLAGDLKNAVIEAEGQGVEVLGIGVMTNDVERFYKDTIVLMDPTRLEDTLMGVLRKKLLDHDRTTKRSA